MKNLFFFLVMLVSSSSFAQSIDCAWAQRAGGRYDDDGTAITTDKSGNVYLTGWYSSSNILFGNITLNNEGIASTYDIFITKYDPAGNIKWAKSFGSIYDEQAYSICTDPNDNIYLTGIFSSPSIEIGDTVLTNSGNNDVLIVKLNSKGEILWAKSLGGFEDEYANCIRTDEFGNVYISGNYKSSSIYFGSSGLNNSGKFDVFLVKYDSSGNEIWVRSAKGSDDEYGGGITIDSYGLVYLLTNFRSPSISFSNNILTNSKNQYFDIVIAQYDPMGNLHWVKKIGGTGSELASSIISDSKNNVYLTGWFSSDSLLFESIILKNKGYDDIFVAKYSLYGNVLWAKSIAGSDDEYGYSLILDKSDNIYVTGNFYSSNIVINNSVLINAGEYDILLIKFDSVGKVLWTKSTGGNKTEIGKSITIDNFDNLYMAGGFGSDSIPFGSSVLVNVGMELSFDIYITKLGKINGMVEYQLNNKEKIITIFPNPTKGNFTVQIPNETGKVEVINSSGKIEQTKLLGPQGSCNLELRTKGIYFVDIYTDKDRYTKKLIVN